MEETSVDDCVCTTSGELGIALSGGGARALAQLGVLKVLDRHKIPVSYVAGTSVGAVIGAVYVTSEDALEAEDRVLEHISSHGTGFNAETFARLAGNESGSVGALIDIGRGLWRAVRQEALVGGEEMRASLHGLLGDATFEAGRIPFATTALDLVSGRRMIFAAGPLVEAVYASSAIPGLFEPLELYDHVLVDGGWAEPVPVNTCHHLGAIHIIAVDVPAARAPMAGKGGIATAFRADALTRDLLEENQLREADFVLRPQVTVAHFADFSDAAGLIEAGERSAEASIDAIEAVIERHQSLFIRARG